MKIRLCRRIVNQKIDQKEHSTSEKAGDSQQGGKANGTETAHSPKSCYTPWCRLCRDYYDNEAYSVGSGGVQGQPAPAEFNTMGVYSINSHNYKAFKYYHPVSINADGWREWYADALADLGAFRSFVHEVRQCGANCWVADCPNTNCGEKRAAVSVVASCKARGCPYCSRLNSKEQQRDLVHRCAQVPTETINRAFDLTKKLEDKCEDLVRKIDRQEELLLKSKSEKAIRFHTRVIENHKKKLKDSQVLMRNIKTDNILKNWAWREWTIGVVWKPWQKGQYDVRSLRERVRIVQKQFKHLWSLVRHGGIATAILCIEMSYGGHVHGHVLYYGPFLPDQWLTREAHKTHKRAGKVTIGLVYDRTKKRWDDKKKKYESIPLSAIKEAIKYATKLPSVTHGAYIGASKKFKVIHPALAANWTLATRSIRLRERFGTILFTEPEEKKEFKPAECPKCHTQIDSIHFFLQNTTQTAFALGKLWKERLRIRAPDI